MTNTDETVLVHFMIRKMPKDDKDAIVFYGRAHDIKTHGMLTAMLRLYEDVLELAKRPDGKDARLLLQRHGLSADMPLLPVKKAS